MGAQLTPEGVKFNGIDTAQTKPVNSVNGVTPNAQGEITIPVGGNAENLIQNLFYDKDIAVNDVAGSTSQSYVWGKSGGTETAGATYVVPEFENFKVNHATKHKLVFYSQEDQFEILVSDLIDINPSTSNYLYLQYDDQTNNDGFHAVYFIGDDLYYRVGYQGTTGGSNTRWPSYRIDLHNFADTPLDVYTKAEVDALITQLSNQITQSSGTGILFFYYNYDNTAAPQNQTLIMNRLNSTYPPATYPAGKRLIMIVNDPEGSGGDTQFRTKGYFFKRSVSSSPATWEFIDDIDSVNNTGSFDWSDIEP